MRALLQRVSRSSVEVDGACVGQIGKGWLVLLGVERGDNEADAAWIADKVTNLRAFEDDQGKMNLSVTDVGGGIHRRLARLALIQRQAAQRLAKVLLGLG